MLRVEATSGTSQVHH